MEVDEPNKVYVTQMLDSIDETLQRTGEEKLKLRQGSYLDCNIELSERYNAGKIGYGRLVELSKRVRDSLLELVRQHAFKIDAINEATHIEEVLRSIDLHDNEHFPKAIYNEWKSPKRSDRWCCTRSLNRLEYNHKVYLVPLGTKILGFISLILSLAVILLEVGLYFEY